jgi:hypothetical protein
LCVAIGLLTPLSLALLGFGYFAIPRFAGTLGDQVAVVLTWCLLFFGAGRHFSVDRLLARSTTWSKVINTLHFAEVPRTPLSTAIVNAFGIFLFWCIAYSAATFHFFDPMWLDLDALQAFMTMPYMSEHSAFFQMLATSQSALYDVGCKLGLAIQCFWELALFPLMFWNWGRLFARWQGYGFFLISALGLNLGYLPFYELVLWTLICTPGTKASTLPAKGSHFSLFPRIAIAAGLTGAIVYLSATTAFQIGRGLGLNVASLEPLIDHKAFRVLGLHPVKVFNRADMDMGNSSLVVAEVDNTGSPIRVVPFQRPDGGRLDYLRNDHLYFDHSLAWQRNGLDAKTTPDGKPRPQTVRLAEQVALLDACIRQKPTAAFKAYMFRRQIEEGERFLEWRQPILVTSFEIRPLSADLGKSTCRYAYDLPPGHFADPPSIAELIAITGLAQNL